METHLKPVNPLDLRDWLIIGLVAVAKVTATAYLFLHPSDMNFAAWCTFATTIVGAYHWIAYKDSKTPDNP